MNTLLAFISHCIGLCVALRRQRKTPDSLSPFRPIFLLCLQMFPFPAPTLEWVPHRVSPPFSWKPPCHPSPGTSQLPGDPGRILLSKTPLVFGSGGAFVLMELSSHQGLRHFKGLAHVLSRKRRLSLGLGTSSLVSGPVGFLPYTA